MSLPRITALVPQGEHWDSTALNEGIWLTTGHVNAIETALTGNETAVTTLTTERDNLQQQLTQAQQAATTTATQHTAALAERDGKIITLQGEVATLKKGPAATFTQTTTEKDAIPAVATAVPSYLDDSNPSNRLADSLFGKPVEKKA